MRGGSARRRLLPAVGPVDAHFFVGEAMPGPKGEDRRVVVLEGHGIADAGADRAASGGRGEKDGVNSVSERNRKRP